MKTEAVRILIVDDDPTQRELLLHLLAGEERTLFTARDGVEGLAVAQAEQPDLIVLDIKMPRMDGFELLKNLRASPAHALTPIFFLTDLAGDDAKFYGFKLGADAFIAKESLRTSGQEWLGEHVAEALQRCELLSRTLANLEDLSVDTTHHDKPALSGTIGQIGVPSLLAILEMERKSGDMSVVSPDGRTASIFLRSGRVIAIELDDDIRNLAALSQILSWPDGRFALHIHPVEREDEIGESTTSLLMSAAQQLDEACR